MNPAAMQAVHLFICLALVCVCICRLNHEVSRLHKRARVRSVIVLTASLLSGAQFLVFRTMATPSESILAGAILLSMVINAGHWVKSYERKK